MKVSKRQLRRIIREEKDRLLSEQPMAAQDVPRQAGMMAELDDIAVGIEAVADGMWGLEDPGDPGRAAGDDMAGELELQIERLTAFHRQMEAYFNEITD
jgi:hypothetical protein